MPTTSANKGYSVPLNLGDAGVWGVELNTTINILDNNLGGALVLQSSASPGGVTLTSSQAQNLEYSVQGALTQSYALTFTSSLGGNGLYVIENATSGAFVVTVTQTSTGSTALTIPQGGRSTIVGNGTTFALADDNATAKLNSILGTPQGNLSGTAATATGGATSIVRDVTNQIEYICKVTGSSSTALWVPNLLPPVGGMLTLSTDANNPVPAADIIGAASVFWTPWQSNWTWASDGTAVFAVQFARMTLTLTNTNNAASQIQDVFYYWNAGTPVIGTGPTWAAGAGGSVTAGACARGTGAGGTALTRTQGVWTNAAAVTINNGANNYAVPIGQGVLLGSIFIDAAAGQVTCHRSYGQSRKWAVSNAFAGSRVPITLREGDPTASWTFNGGVNVYRVSHADTTNNAVPFSCLAEEIVAAQFIQVIAPATGVANMGIGIGWNSQTVASGFNWPNVNGAVLAFAAIAQFEQTAPPLGINTVYSLESSNDGGDQFRGTEARMLMTLKWRA